MPDDIYELAKELEGALLTALEETIDVYSGLPDDHEWRQWRNGCWETLQKAQKVLYPH